MNRRIIMVAVSILAAGVIPSAILLLSFRENPSSSHSLRGGEVVTIDFGFPTVSGYDFKAQSEIRLANHGDTPIRIEKICRSCSCQTLVLEPEDRVLPGQSLRVRFAHADATNGKGGYFFDRILL